MNNLALNSRAGLASEKSPMLGQSFHADVLPKEQNSKEARVEEITMASPGNDAIQNHQNFVENIKNKLNHYAGIIDSRESVTRLILDLTAFDIPTVIAGATRNWSSFLEACLESSLSSFNLIIAPSMTKLMANFAGKLFLDKEDQKHFDKLARFYRTELHDEEGFKNGVKRILNEEPKDLDRIANLYLEAGNNAKSQSYKNQANSLNDYFRNIKFKSDRLKSLIDFKETTLLFESFFEGGIWGGFGLLLRWFRKNILKQDTFTGTNKYVNKDEAKKLGQDLPLKIWQKVMGVGAMFLSPAINFTLMKLCRNRESVEKNKFLQLCDSGLDMTHGLFPKLGLLFSFTTVPKWFGALATVQGKDELIERIMKLFSVMPSWWLGHRVTNGLLAKAADKSLVKKYGVQAGIMLEKEQLNSYAPDPAKIHHILEQTQNNPALQKEARSKHAKVLYSGLSLHSLGVLGVSLLINQITKWRVKNKLGMP
jgi:hypothetical protein